MYYYANSIYKGSGSELPIRQSRLIPPYDDMPDSCAGLIHFYNSHVLVPKLLNLLFKDWSFSVGHIG